MNGLGLWRPIRIKDRQGWNEDEYEQMGKQLLIWLIQQLQIGYMEENPIKPQANHNGQSQSFSKEASFVQSSIDQKVKLCNLSDEVAGTNRSVSVQTTLGGQEFLVHSEIVQKRQQEINRIAILRSLQPEPRKQSFNTQSRSLIINNISQSSLDSIYGKYEQQYPQNSPLKVERPDQDENKEGSLRAEEALKVKEGHQKEETQETKYYSREQYDYIFKKYKRYKDLYLKEQKKSEYYKKELRVILQRFS